MVDQEALVYGPKAGCMVDQVYLSFLGHGLRAPGSCTGGRRGRILYFLLACSRRRRAPGEPCQRHWCPIEEGKSFPGSRRLRLWDQGAARASPRCWPRRSTARRGGARRRAPSSGAGVQLRWATARPYHRECPGDASEVAGRLLLAGRGGGGAPAVARCGLRGPPVIYVHPDRERGIFRDEKEPVKAVVSLLLR